MANFYGSLIGFGAGGGPVLPYNIESLVIAGGGSGAPANYGGGAGAGAIEIHLHQKHLVEGEVQKHHGLQI